MTEEWRPIPEFDGYEISDLGRVRSLKRRQPKIMSPSKSKRGYMKVALWRNGAPHYHSVHRLVAKVFVPGYRKGLLVCHGPVGNSDNSASNLRWDTVSANAIDASRLGDIPRQVLNEAQVREIRDLYQTGKHTHRSLARDFGVTHQAIRDLLIRKNYRWVA